MCIRDSIGPPKDDVPTHPLNTPRSSTRVITPGGNRNEAYYKATLTYGQLSAEAKALDNHMYTVMQMNVKGSKAALLAHVTFSSYVQAMIVLHKHIDISSNSRKTEALESIDNLKLNGTVQQWALDSVSKFQELRDSKVTIEDYGLFCLVKSLAGKSKVVQHEMIRDINSADDKSHFPIYDMVQKYASEMAAVDGAKTSSSNNVDTPLTPPVNSIKDIKCHNCGEMGHYMRECPKPRNVKPGEKPGDFGQKGTKYKFKYPCSKCGDSGHKRKDCPKKEGNIANSTTDDSLSDQHLLKMLDMIKTGQVGSVSAQLSEEEVAQWMIENNSVDSNFGSNSVPSSVVTTFLCCGRCHRAMDHIVSDGEQVDNCFPLCESCEIVDATPYIYLDESGLQDRVDVEAWILCCAGIGCSHDGETVKACYYNDEVDLLVGNKERPYDELEIADFGWHATKLYDGEAHPMPPSKPLILFEPRRSADAYQRLEVIRVDNFVKAPLRPLDPSLHRNEQVVLDNCAGLHLFHCERFFIEWNDNPSCINIQVAAGNPQITCNRQGTVVFVDIETGEFEELRNVMYHNKGNDNIVSEGQWAKDSPGYEFIVRGEDHLIVKFGQAPRRTRKVGNHGVLHVRPLDVLEKEAYLARRTYRTVKDAVSYTHLTLPTICSV